MNTGLDQYMDIFKDAVEDSAAKITKSFEKILIEVIILFMVIPRKINFTQMGRYGSHVEQTYRNAKGYTGLMDCQARDKWKLDFAFNASFTSLNVAKVTMKEMGMEYSMSSFKSLMTNIYLVRRIFKASGYTPNRTLISKIFKDLSCLQRIAA